MFNKTFITYKFYDETGRRLAIFGEFFPSDSILEIAIFPCSKKNHFSKKTAKFAYEKLLISVEACHEEKFHPILDTVQVYENSPRKTFFNYCFENFCRMVTITHRLPVLTTLLKSKDVIIGRKDELNHPSLNKMDFYA